jgi:phosphatidylglycerol lysyltransferase
MLAGGLALTWPAHAAAKDDQTPREVVMLTRGMFAALRLYSPESPGGTHAAAPRALIVFGSGDGGWSYWEERVCRHLAARGCVVAGIDFARYAASDFSAEIVAKDFATLVAELRKRHPAAAQAPVLYGGWSMGAEHSLPAAAEAQVRPRELRGLLLVAPGARGRFGLRTSDKLFTPHGDNTFALRDVAPRLRDLPMAVFHGGLDPLDDLNWDDDLGLNLRLWTIPRVFHDFGNAGPEFLAALTEALDWMVPVAPPGGAKASKP